jgi:hypothetical protein
MTNYTEAAQSGATVLLSDGTTVRLAFNPADVVSIPSDYNDTKGRTWRYIVVGELETNPEDALKGAVQVGA